MKNTTLILGICLILLNCQNEKKTETNSQENTTKVSTEDKDLNRLFGMMQGSFNSEKQASADSTYYNIALHMYPIWKDQGNYLYVEQALASTPEKPYRQRVYEVKRLNDSTISSAIYTIPNDSLWIGKWKTIAAFDSISPKDISIKQGCEVLLRANTDGSFSGSTGEGTCKSTLFGSTYATSHVSIKPNQVMSWDRGFDKDGNYVWGAQKGGYIFNKIN
ncbi:MAG: hypothetical protein BM564_10560 [Bacteroidetes bacterium MedPE-SWsnd-G2]|nr:MAG: hypothetical protein BM564_10560 [Bacteroidetes bacterium MedPE-SWsnd-G2]